MWKKWSRCRTVNQTIDCEVRGPVNSWLRLDSAWFASENESNLLQFYVRFFEFFLHPIATIMCIMPRDTCDMFVFFCKRWSIWNVQYAEWNTPITARHIGFNVQSRAESVCRWHVRRVKPFSKFKWMLTRKFHVSRWCRPTRAQDFASCIEGARDKFVLWKAFWYRKF